MLPRASCKVAAPLPAQLLCIQVCIQVRPQHEVLRHCQLVGLYLQLHPGPLSAAYCAEKAKARAHVLSAVTGQLPWLGEPTWPLSGDTKDSHLVNVQAVPDAGVPRALLWRLHYVLPVA